MNELRLLADNIKDRLKSGIIVVTSIIDSQAGIVCMVTKDLSGKYNAGEIIKNISSLAGGKGGGKPEKNIYFIHLYFIAVSDTFLCRIL